MQANQAERSQLFHVYLSTSGTCLPIAKNQNEPLRLAAEACSFRFTNDETWEAPEIFASHLGLSQVTRGFS